jgi:hypothetical protein
MKLSGLAIDTEYVFHLVLRTSAGTYSSEKLRVQTHKMTDLSGITITPGHMPPALRESLQVTADRIGAKIVDTVRIDTTHFVCTEGRGPMWEKAVDMNIPVVVPDWLKGCEREGRIVGVRGYYLTADPRMRQLGPGQSQTQGQPQLSVRSPPPMPSPRTEVTPPTPERPTHDRREESEEDAAPPPPPKDSVEEQSEDDEEETREQKTQTDEQKVRTEDLKPSAEETDEGDSEEEAEKADGDAKAAEAGIPVRSKPGQTSIEDEDERGSFQDVDL